MTTPSSPKTIQKAKSEMEKSRSKVTSCETEITNIKAVLRELGSTFEEQKELNSIKILAIKANFLDKIQPNFKIQLSCPTEPKSLIGIYNNKANDNNTVAEFKGVDVTTAKVTFSIEEDSKVLYSSISYDLKPLCEFNVLKDVKEKINELEVMFMPEEKGIKKEDQANNDIKKIYNEERQEKKKDEEANDNGKKIETKVMAINNFKDVVKNDETRDKNNDSEKKEYNDSKLLTPSKTIHATFQIEYYPSRKDKSDILYDMLNNVSSRKATAIDELRKSASLYNKLDKKQFKEEKVIQPGFLKINPKKKPGALSKLKNSFICLYNITVSERSLLRSVLIPCLKNYVIFFGSVWWLHYYGQYLVLPPPV